MGESWKVEWEVLEVEIDLSILGPVKVFSRVSKQYTLQRPTYQIYNTDDDLLLYLPLRHGGRPRAPPSVQFLRVGEPDKARVTRLGGVDKMRLSRLSVDKDAGFVVISAEGDWPRQSSFIWWLDESKPGNIVHSRTKELILSWSRGLLRRF